MAIQTCLSRVFTIRFDFGVPLEDVFPPQDIHPRLKFLFKKAVEAYVNNGCNINYILRYGQGPLHERLSLKTKIILSLDYRVDVNDFSSGAYFWLIRHFLGLLPLPLLPFFTNGTYFNWKSLVDQCKSVIRYGDHYEKDVLDNQIAQTINMLPIANLILFNVIIEFFQKLSISKIRRRRKFDRKALLELTNYYCSSLFVRPFRPGSSEGIEYRPLLLYFILRWQYISDHCNAIGHPTYFVTTDLEPAINRQKVKSEYTNYCSSSNFLANAFFNPEAITICRNIPCLVNFCNKYLKDIACQTETNLCANNDFDINGNKDLVEKYDLLQERNKLDAYKLAYIEEVDEDSQASVELFFENNASLYQTAQELPFNSYINEDRSRDWKNIVQDTMDTVRKVEGSYIYDDYETFKKEEFNQIAKKDIGSILSKISKYGLFISPRKSPKKDQPKSSTPKKNSPESDNSYIKYSGISDSDSYNSDRPVDESKCGEDKNRDLAEIKINDHIKNYQRKIPVAQKLFQNNNSPMSVKSEDSREGLHEENTKKSKREYFVQRFRVSLDFLRALTPKKNTFKIIEKKIRYHRIRNGKCHTI